MKVLETFKVFKNIIMKKNILLLSLIFAGIVSFSQKNGAGLNFDDAKYAKTLMKAPLTRSLYTNIPSNYSLKQYTPNPQSQGQYGTCVGWSTAYAALTTTEARLNNWTDKIVITENAYSPGFIYKQIKSDADANCTWGASIEDALEIMKTKGCSKFSDMPEVNCPDVIPLDVFNKASDHKIKDYAKVFDTYDDRDFKVSATKKSLSQNNPVLIGMKVPDSFYACTEQWLPTEDSEQDYSGHAMCVIGYDDDKFGGAFEIMNSWGNTWGNGGYFWISYDNYAAWVKYAFEMIDMIPNNKNIAFDISGNVRFVTTDGKEMRVSRTGESYTVTNPVKSGTLFRIYLSNSQPAYVYAFGSDATGKVFPVFPHKPNISAALTYSQNDVPIPDESNYIQTDNTVGTDWLCVLYSKNPLNIQDISNSIESNSGTFIDKLKTSLGSMQVNPANITFQSSKMEFTAKSGQKTIVALIIQTNHIE